MYVLRTKYCHITSLDAFGKTGNVSLFSWVRQENRPLGSALGSVEMLAALERNIAALNRARDEAVQEVFGVGS